MRPMMFAPAALGGLFAASSTSEARAFGYTFTDINVPGSRRCSTGHDGSPKPPGDETAAHDVDAADAGTVDRSHLRPDCTHNGPAEAALRRYGLAIDE